MYLLISSYINIGNGLRPKWVNTILIAPAGKKTKLHLFSIYAREWQLC